MKKYLLGAAFAALVLHRIERSYLVSLKALASAMALQQEVEYAKTMTWSASTFQSVFSAAAHNGLTDDQHEMLRSMVDHFDMEWAARPAPPSERGGS
jgi:hypothetical protein